MSVSRGNHAEKNCSFETYLEPVCTSTPKKGQSRCLDLYDSDSSSVDLGTPAKRRSSPSTCWVDLNDSNSTSERWNDCTPIKEAMVESTPQNASQSVSVDMVDSDDESVIASTYDDQHVDGAAKQIKMKPSIKEIVSLHEEDDSWIEEEATVELQADKPQDEHWLVSCLKGKTIFLDLISESEENVSSLVKWLDSSAQASVSSFLNKKVDVVITNRDDNMRKAASSLRTSTSQKRSLMMVGMAASVERRGSSSNVFSIAAKWNMKVLKYEDVL